MLQATFVSDSSRRRGAIVAILALSLPVLIGVAALSLDAGVLLVQRRQAQAMAEGIAMAAAYQLKINPKNTSDATTAANGLASIYGVTNPIINMPPTSGIFANQAGYVQVSVKLTSPKLFSAIWGAGNMSATASAVAGSGSGAYSTAALLALNPSGTSVTLSGTTSLTATNGSIIVNSTSSTAVLSSGSPSITAPALDLSGGIKYSGTNPNKATVTNSGQPSTPDPLADIAAPSSTSMTNHGSIDLSGSATTTLSPGIYSGISLSGSSAVTLSPGVYYINGPMNVSGTSSISGDGVFIYKTGSGAVNLSGTGEVSLSPMAGGPYSGITMFQDRTSTTGATMSGSGNISNTGTFYFPDATLTLSGTSGVNVMGAQIIAKNLTLSGTATINVNYDSSVAGQSTALAIVQ